MMAEGVNNNGHNNDHLSGNEYEILDQGSISNVQVESISRFLSECPEAALSVHKFLQTNYSKSNQQQQIVQPVNSTPKRGHPLDESGSSINNGRGRRKYPRKGIDSNAHKQSQFTQQEINLQPQLPSSSSTSSGERQQQVINQASTNRKRISFNQLKHAVSSNLPCFFIEFTSDADRHSIPTALHASDLILKELQSKGVLIKKFTLIGWSGEKLKLGVNNKEDYATLVGSDKWPTKINGIDIVVSKPKYVPDSFALVVRYVPRELEENFVSNEIQRTIASADRIKRIHYSYQRRTDDYRFDVKDYSEYNAVLQLGRIAIGHSWLSITKFYPGNRLTYCTKCWCIGHLRNKCNSENKCRICLENLSVDTPHLCKNEPKCAQCDGNHHSLDNQCQVIKEYKDQLKEDVEDAIQKGLLQRLSLQEKSPMYEHRDQDFPPLTTSDNHSKKQWNIAQPRTSDTEKTFESINDNLAKLIDSNKRLENKGDLQATKPERKYYYKRWIDPTYDTSLDHRLKEENEHKYEEARLTTEIVAKYNNSLKQKLHLCVLVFDGRVDEPLEKYYENCIVKHLGTQSRTIFARTKWDSMYMKTDAVLKKEENEQRQLLIETVRLDENEARIVFTTGLIDKDAENDPEIVQMIRGKGFNNENLQNMIRQTVDHHWDNLQIERKANEQALVASNQNNNITVYTRTAHFINNIRQKDSDGTEYHWFSFEKFQRFTFQKVDCEIPTDYAQDPPHKIIRQLYKNATKKEIERSEAIEKHFPDLKTKKLNINSQVASEATKRAELIKNTTSFDTKPFKIYSSADFVYYCKTGQQPPLDDELWTNI
ncbi:unnamed protein product [Rotaria socialis]|uniref:Uncharacterized protein n=2 Tax=Rotaria socialis TaxID=392032 RepID=A0A818FJF2_9BILA|nr:unnamed protein product [Rotaria socialis]